MGHPHTTIAMLRAFLNEILRNKWIERRDLIEYPPRSPDLKPMNFFSREYLRNKVYAMKLKTVAELRAATALERTQIRNEMLRDVCGFVASPCQHRLGRNRRRFENIPWQNLEMMLMNSINLGNYTNAYEHIGYFCYYLKCTYIFLGTPFMFGATNIALRIWRKREFREIAIEKKQWRIKFCEFPRNLIRKGPKLKRVL